MAAGAGVSISSKKLLIVEGKDEVNFFKAALDHLKIVGVQVMDIAGKSQLTANLKALVLDANFPAVTSIGIVRDADATPVGSPTTAAVGAFQSVCGSLTASGVGLTAPAQHGSWTNGTPRVGVFVMPDGSSDGMLEDLCLTSVAGDVEMGCVKDFFACCAKVGAVPDNRAKAEAHAYLASRPEPDKRVGEAARKGYWPFAATAFDDLWTFIRAL